MMVMMMMKSPHTTVDDGPSPQKQDIMQVD